MKLNIAHSIRLLRRERGVTQEVLAAALGVTAQAVSRWEAGATYPDMELIPALANYFGISIDRLFGYSGEREAKITALLAEIDRLSDASWRDAANLDACIAALRQALEEFPGNERIMNRLAQLLKQAGWTRYQERSDYSEDGHLHTDADHHRENPCWAEAVRLFQRLAADAADQELRHAAASELVLLYRMTGDTEQARKIAQTMPCVALSREILLAAATDGAQKTACHAEACLALLRAFREQVIHGLMNERANFDTDMPVRMIQGLIGLYDLLFSDGNMGPQHAAVCDLYLYLSRLQWACGQQDEAFESLDQALVHARRFDALTEREQYTAPLMRYARLRLPDQGPGDLARNLPLDWPVWQLPDCTAAAKEIKADPRWAAWVRRTQA